MSAAAVAGSNAQPEATINAPLIAKISVYLYVILTPFMLLPSGLPQPADFVFLATGVPLLLVYRAVYPGRYGIVMRLLGYWVVYVALISLFYAITAADVEILWNPLFYAYNALICAVLIRFYVLFGKPVIAWITHGVAISILLQTFLAVFVVKSISGRATLFFNGPNQLGYFIVLGAAIFLFGGYVLKLPGWYVAIVVGACLFLCALSISRAGASAILFLGLVYSLKKPGMMIGIILILLALLQFGGFAENVEKKFVARTSAERLAQDKGRGYDRMWNHPEYLFFGAAEGANYRFESRLNTSQLFKSRGARQLEDQIGGKAMHSTPGTLLFSYGIPGTIILTLFCIACMRGAGLLQLLLWMPILIYGLTHQGLRETFFWISLCMFLFLCMEEEKKKLAGSTAAPPQLA